MSKIQELLNQGSIINVNLMSDQLNTILSELCTVISEQSQEIQSLKEEIKKNATHDEIDSQYEILKEELTKISNETKKNSNDNQILAQTINEINAKASKQFQKEITESKNELISEMESRKKDMDGANLIVNQQIKSIWQRIDKDISTSINSMKEDISSVQTIIEKGKSQSLEALSYKVEQLENKMNENKKITTETQANQDNDLQQIKTKFTDFQNEVKDEIKFFTTEIHDIRKVIVDAPSFDLDGKIDTETIINAIKRDSRRIDSFNEIISNVRNQNDIVSQLFVDLSNIVSQVQSQLQEFIKEHNSTKFSIIDQIDQSYANTELLRKDFNRIDNSVEETIKACLNSMNTISSTFSSLYLFLGKLTTRNLPKFPTFDDEVLEFQRIYDSTVSDHESKNSRTDPFSTCLIHKDHANKQVGQFSTDESINELKAEFQLPLLLMPKVDLNIENKNSIVNCMSSEKVDNKQNFRKPSNFSYLSSSNSDYNSNADLSYAESKQSIIELTKSISNLKDQLDNVKTTVDKGETKKKADSKNIERMLDRVKEMNTKVQNSINSMNQNLLNYVQRDEINEIIKECINASSQNVVHANTRSRSPPLLTASHYIRKPQKTRLPMLLGSNILANEIVKDSRWGSRSKSTVAHTTVYGVGANGESYSKNEQNQNLNG